MKGHGKPRAATALALVMTASACAVGPDFHRPEEPPGSGYTSGPAMDRTSGADARNGQSQNFVPGQDIPGEWWKMFHSPELDAYVREALANNPTLEQAQASLRQAREAVYVERGQLYPQVNGTANATRSKNSTAEFGGATTSAAGGTSAIPFNLLYTVYDASVSASYNVDIWGGTRREIESEEAQQEYQQYELEAAYLSVTSNVVAAAVQDASLRAQIKANEDIISIESDALRILNAQFELGGISKVDVLTQQTTVAQARANLPPLRKQLAQTRNQLMALMGRFPNQDDGKVFDLDKLTLPAELPVSLPSDLVNQRPDVRAAETEVHSALAEVGVSTANLLPQLTLNASFGDEAVSASSLFGPESEIFSLGAGLTQPIFRGGTLLHQKREAEANADEALANYRVTVIGAFQDVANALRAVEADADALKANVEANRSAENSLNIAKLQFDAGSLTYLTLLTTEQQYQQTRLALAQAEAQRYADTAALFQALGGGWWNRGDVLNEDEADYIDRREAAEKTWRNAMTDSGKEGQ